MRGRIDPRREDGVAMTEFAIIAPVFLLLLVGILVFGRLFFYWIEANHVANETARWAVVDRNPYAPLSFQERARASATGEFQDNASVCIDFPDPDTPGAFQSRDDVEPGDPVRVRVQLPFSFVKFFGWGVTIRGSATMRLERIVDTTDPTQPIADPGLNEGSCS